MNIGDALLRTARDYPDRIGLIDKFGKHPTVHANFTWRELNEKVNRLANGLLAMGLKRQERVGVYSETRTQFFIAFFAILCFFSKTAFFPIFIFSFRNAHNLSYGPLFRSCSSRPPSVSAAQ